jgi:hypothetical protein
MSDLLTHVARSLAVDVDLDLEPQCASLIHDEGGEGVTRHAGNAVYWQVGHCVHGTGLRCAPAVASIQRFPFSNCRICGTRGLVSEMRFIEL